MEEWRMQITVEFNDAAFRHGISEADIRNAIGAWLYDDMWDACICGCSSQGKEKL
jgi:hypothetical protein